jgi:large subunit ribosomal protein L19
MDLLRHFEQEQTKDVERPKLKAGDIVRVEMKITEEEKTRLQTFEGTVLMVRGSGPSTTFTIRREVSGFGVERIFPLYNPLITNIEIVKRQKVRRAKLSYLRQSGRRRFKEDVKAMQSLIKAADKKKRLAEGKAKKEADAEAKEASDKKKAKKEAEAEKAETSPDTEVNDKAPEQEKPKESEEENKE